MPIEPGGGRSEHPDTDSRFIESGQWTHSGRGAGRSTSESIGTVPTATAGSQSILAALVNGIPSPPSGTLQVAHKDGPSESRSDGPLSR